MLTEADVLNMLISSHRCGDIIIAESMKGTAVEIVRRHENSLAILRRLRYASFPDVFGTFQSGRAQPVYNVSGHNFIQHSQRSCMSSASNNSLPQTITRNLHAPSMEADPIVAQVDAPLTNIYAKNRRTNAESSLTAHSTALRQVKSEGHVSEILDHKTLILRDAKGRRLDPTLKVSESLVDSIEGGRLCNNFHLKGQCPFRKCKYLHFLRDEKTQEERLLTAEEKETLRSMARRSPCKHGTTCNDPHCYAGHRCPNHTDKSGVQCSFPESMHFVVAEPVISESRKASWS